MSKSPKPRRPKRKVRTKEIESMPGDVVSFEMERQQNQQNQQQQSQQQQIPGGGNDDIDDLLYRQYDLTPLPVMMGAEGASPGLVPWSG